MHNTMPKLILHHSGVEWVVFDVEVGLGYGQSAQRGLSSCIISSVDLLGTAKNGTASVEVSEV